MWCVAGVRQRRLTTATAAGRLPKMAALPSTSADLGPRFFPSHALPAVLIRFPGLIYDEIFKNFLAFLVGIAVSI